MLTWAVRQPIRLATKDMEYEESWWGDYTNEANYTRRLNDAGCENVIKALEWTIYKNPDFFRIAYEVADHGDLSNLYDFYQKHQ